MSTGPVPVAVVGYLLRETSIRLQEPFQRTVESRGRTQAFCGGSGANIASNLAVMGVRAELIGTVGDDEVGRQLVAEYSHANLSVDLVRVGRSAQITTVVEPNGERSFLVDQGDTHAIGVADVPPRWLAPPRALVLPAFNLYWDPDSFNDVGIVLAKSAKASGVPLVIDAASARLIDSAGRQRVRDLLVELSPDVVSASADEATALGIHADDPATWPSAGITLIHRGADPTSVLISYDGKPEVVTVPVPPVSSIVDSTGAGDAFLAGFVASWLDGAGVVPAVHTAHAAAARKLMVVGPSLPRGSSAVSDRVFQAVLDAGRSDDRYDPLSL